jgi:tRNA dimethylallyltransferase
MLTGRPLSSLFEERRRAPITSDPVLIGLTLDRTVLYRRIEGRVDEMIRSGLENEVRQLVASGYDERLPSMSGLGYKQWFGYFRGDYGLPEVAALLKRDTRRYAKRQMTWFRRDARIRWVDVDSEGAIARLADEISGMFDPMGISH